MRRDPLLERDVLRRASRRADFPAQIDVERGFCNYGSPPVR